jgi:solute:Na+ symporter, SSS family
MVSLSIWDILVLSVYGCIVLFIGFKTSRNQNSDLSEYLLAGRRLSLPMFVATFVSTWYGGVLGVGEMTYRYGISNWVMQGLPYYIFGLIFAFTLAKKIRKTSLSTIPDKIEYEYDKKTSLLSSIFTFILVTPAPYILMIAVFLQLLFGLNLLISLIISSIISISYLYFGGFKSDVYTDIFEFFIMFLGIGIIIPFSYSSYGDFGKLFSNLPPLHLNWTGGNSIQYILVWFFIALWTMVDPTFHQRCYAAKNEKIAQRGILLSIIFWFIFDTLTTLTGLYSRAILPNLSEPMYAYPLLAEKVLPPFAKGFFYAGILATIMSTLNSYAFISAQSLGKDFWGRFKNINDDKIIQKYIKYSLIFSTVVSIILSFFIPSVINLWYTIGTAIVPALLIPLITCYYPKSKISSNQVFILMFLGWFISTFSLLWGQVMKNGDIINYLFGMEPMYLGLISTSVIYLIFKMYNRIKL